NECPGFDLSWSARLGRAHAEKLWARLDREALISFQPKGVHSDDVVAIDSEGNMVSLCHSINCLIWGRTAIVVDGVSIGDPGSYLQPLVAATARGAQMPNAIELGLILNNGQPEIAWSSMGMGLHYQSTLSLLNIIDHGMSIEQAANAPRLLAPMSPDGDFKKLILRVVAGEFPEEVLNESGLDVQQIKPLDARFVQGLWIAIQRDPATGELVAISPSYNNGQAAAY
ncbi:MAG: gamma-glutamyltransferase, partial [Steroidobacter sp.]